MEDIGVLQKLITIFGMLSVKIIGAIVVLLVSQKEGEIKTEDQALDVKQLPQLLGT